MGDAPSPLGLSLRLLLPFAALLGSAWSARAGRVLDIIIVIIRRRPRDPHQVLRFGLRLQRHRRHRIPPVLHHFLYLSLYLAALSRTPAAAGLATFVVISCERPSIAIGARESLHAEERPGSGPGSGSGSGRAARRGEEGRRDWIPDDRQGVVRRRCEPTDAAVGGACARNKRTEEEHAGGAEDRPCSGRGRRRGADEELPQPQVSQSNCKLSLSLSLSVISVGKVGKPGRFDASLLYREAWCTMFSIRKTHRSSTRACLTWTRLRIHPFPCPKQI